MKTKIGFAALLGVLSGACAEEPAVGEASSPLLTYNGRYLNGISTNALVTNGIDLANGLASLDLGDPTVHQFVEYLVSCVLPEGDAVAVEGETFGGGVGLAPEWAEGACGEDCQRWASSCLLARVNARGEHVQISMRGPHPALHPAPRELVEFAREEGTYYGNLFASPDRSWASSARDDLELPRTCGESIDGCYVDVVGHSDDVCAGRSRAQGRRDCRDGDGAAWAQGITVYLP